MKKFIIPFIVLSTLLFSCKDDDKTLDNKKSYYEISINEVFQVSLHSYAADGGYRWEWIKSESSLLDSVKYNYTIDYPENIGSPGTDIWDFKGLKPGTETLKFRYKRPFDENSTIQTKEIIVKIN